MINKWLRENMHIVGFVGLSISSGMAGGIMQLVIPLYAISLSASDAGVGLIRGGAQLGGLIATLSARFT